MIDVTEVLMDPDFVTNFTVIRTTSGWVGGRFTEKKKENLRYSFPAHPATEKELEQLPEGDRSKEVMTFFCVRPKSFYLSEPVMPEGDENNEDIVYDFIHYKGNCYKLIKIKDWNSHGWMRGYGVLIGPAGKE